MKKADALDPFAIMEQAGQEVDDKRFLAQLAGVKALAEKGDWRGVTLGCKMLYRLADLNGSLEKVEPVLRPFFNLAVEKFEKSRAAMVRLYSRLLSASRKVRQIERLARISRAST